MSSTATVYEQSEGAESGARSRHQLRQGKATQVQQERLGAMSQMARGIAHDINNSLTPIIGYADFILETQPGLPDDLRKYLGCIRAAAGDIASRVEQVRQFYRSRDTHEVLQCLDLHREIGEVLEGIQSRCQTLTERTGAMITIETDWAPSTPTLWENAGELREAIRQLALNAVEAMPEGGTLKISTWADTCQVGLEMTDTGIGMTGEIRQHCFEPFFSTKMTRGSGLGLAMVYGFMRRHDGNIEVESHLGLGTTVRLLFHPGEPGDKAGSAD